MPARASCCAACDEPCGQRDPGTGTQGDHGPADPCGISHHSSGSSHSPVAARESTRRLLPASQGQVSRPACDATADLGAGLRSGRRSRPCKGWYASSWHRSVFIIPAAQGSSHRTHTLLGTSLTFNCALCTASATVPAQQQCCIAHTALAPLTEHIRYTAPSRYINHRA